MKTYDAFPEPIGGYTVGRTQMDFDYTASDHSKRELTAFVYYPSDSSEGKTASTYMFPEVYEMLDEQPLLTALKDAYSIDIKTQCYDDLALSGKEKRYPVLFYVCGGGGSPEWGTVICTDLASMGYVVVSIGHQNSTMYKRKDLKIRRCWRWLVRWRFGLTMKLPLRCAVTCLHCRYLPKNFFDHYILQKAASVESLAYDGVDLIKKTSNK